MVLRGAHIQRCGQAGSDLLSAQSSPHNLALSYGRARPLTPTHFDSVADPHVDTPSNGRDTPFSWPGTLPCIVHVPHDHQWRNRDNVLLNRRIEHGLRAGRSRTPDGGSHDL